MGMSYPTVDEIVEINKSVLGEIKVKKADRPKLLPAGKKRLEQILEEVKSVEGDLYDKAVVLLGSLIKKHPFESGNRRTALTITATFLRLNGEAVKIAHDEKVLQGIREGFYSEEEIKAWLRGGEVREFKR